MTPASSGSGEVTRGGLRRVGVADPLDVFVARWSAQRIAGEIGFVRVAANELAIVVSELATNILKYGVRGEIALGPVDGAPHGRGLEIIAEDEGPPIADLDLALRDGYGDRGPIAPEHWLGRGGIGAGLGAVIRLTDSFEYRPGAGRKSFRVVRYLHRPRKQA
ncbi:MAG TPA: ATP-binding protein [Kofleriaceae bacterium]|nr:ATP-binding protein [Kofleriaceae bacterium]